MCRFDRIDRFFFLENSQVQWRRSNIFVYANTFIIIIIRYYFQSEYIEMHELFVFFPLNKHDSIQHTCN